MFCIGVRSSKKIVINTDYDEFNRLININAISFLRIYKKLYQNLRKNNANVLVVSSSASLDNKKTNGAYSTSKACLDSISETLKKEKTEYGVTINVIHPSLFDSKLAHEIVEIKGYDDFDKYVAEVILIECGFLSNPTDSKNLTNEKYKIKYTKDLSNYIKNYFKQN